MTATIVRNMKYYFYKKGFYFDRQYDFNVFNDCPLLGGTKIRAIVPLISKITEKRIIYVGPTIGFAQIAFQTILILMENHEVLCNK